MHEQQLKDFLEEKVNTYNRVDFIENDPICIPHRYSMQQDIEIMGFWSAMLAWGQRKTIINKCNELSALMDHAPYDFVLNHSENDLKKLTDFKHRTFNTTDTLYFLTFFRYHYQNHESLEQAFLLNGQFEAASSLSHFHNYFFSLEDAPHRTRKHIASPAKKATCKRLNMFLRWMVRQDDNGVDFGIWNNISPRDLYCPLDVHVDRVARKLGLIERKQTDWKTTAELTNELKKLDSNDPVKYDFALFGLGIEEKY